MVSDRATTRLDAPGARRQAPLTLLIHSIMAFVSSPRYLFRSATIIEGDDDSTPYTADVLVSPPYIFAIASDLSQHVEPDVTEIDARGKVLCPGFIDMHAHSDLYLLTHPEHEAKVSQGVTTEVVGQDGGVVVQCLQVSGAEPPISRHKLLSHRNVRTNDFGPRPDSRMERQPKRRRVRHRARRCGHV